MKYPDPYAPLAHNSGRYTHRELMYDPQTSNRAFKRVMQGTTAGGKAEEAWSMGQASVMSDVPKRWQTNPYPPGRRRRLYDEGRAAALADRDEARTERGWQR
jgi:hypothetical protein